jgi:LysM repeat protein
MKSSSYFIVLFMLGFNLWAQVADTIKITSTPIFTDTLGISESENKIYNSKMLNSFLAKLEQLQKQKSGKVNIVHIGDSHIQADFMTSKTRKKLQAVFGNGGRGFVFPYNLAKTNGAGEVRFSSDAQWSSYRIVAPVTENQMGLSGIELSTKSRNFYIELGVKDDENKFTTLKIITPKNDSLFQIALEKKMEPMIVEKQKKVFHKVKKGETAEKIADKYCVDLEQLKQINNLKFNKIARGKTIQLPKFELYRTLENTFQFDLKKINKEENTRVFKADSLLTKIYIVADSSRTNHTINGLILENNAPGILYHNIGVNGAKLSDYNKYPLIFEQLKALQPDLVIVSLGTNESFSKIKSENYLIDLEVFIKNIKVQIPAVELLVVTPPPSLFHRKFPNTFVADYTQKLTNIAPESNFAVWDLHTQLGGFYGINKLARSYQINTDRVHYTKMGYEKQGEILADAIIKLFEEYLAQKNKSN